MTTQASREVTWGDGLVVAAFHADGGLKAAVDRIHAAVGPHIGNRNTFAKFLRVEDPGTLRERDRFRAWLLITALGEDAPAWGVSDDVVPSAFDLEELRCAIRDSNPEPADSKPRAVLLSIVGRSPRVAPVPIGRRVETLSRRHLHSVGGAA